MCLSLENGVYVHIMYSTDSINTRVLHTHHMHNSSCVRTYELCMSTYTCGTIIGFCVGAGILAFSNWTHRAFQMLIHW